MPALTAASESSAAGRLLASGGRRQLDRLGPNTRPKRRLPVVVEPGPLDAVECDRHHLVPPPPKGGGDGRVLVPEVEIGERRVVGVQGREDPARPELRE